MRFFSAWKERYCSYKVFKTSGVVQYFPKVSEVARSLLCMYCSILLLQFNTELLRIFPFSRYSFHIYIYIYTYIYIYILTILSMFVLLFEQRKTYFRVQQAKKTNQSRGAQPRTKTLQMSIFFKNSALFQQFSQNCA